MNKKTYPHRKETRALIFFDFDETYFPHACTVEQLAMLQQMEMYLHDVCHQYHVKIGWVTGSSMAHIESKMQKANLTYWPHFISSNLGTELYMIDEEGNTNRLSEWEAKIEASGFSKEAVQSLLHQLCTDYQVVLTPQTQFGQQGYKMNYYYYTKSEQDTHSALGIIRKLADKYEVEVNINRCNPKAGDPENAYDVDFIPKGTGKAATVHFMKAYYDVSHHQTLAFGDSGNDIDMLKAVKHGYLLFNATDEAKSLHAQHTSAAYGEGIMEVCQQVFSSVK
ncbi:HAD-IIB family hydrolase [Priestia sp. GS2]|uniref:HAD-IIB family hydrolase n=1 Tax=Priestia sp. GS2 TaxID=3117403 RepID=UPI002ED9E20D